MSAENWAVVAAMGVYLVFMVWVGKRASHRVTDLNSYILSNRNLPWHVLVLTLLATVASPVQLLGQPGIAYQQGISLFFWEKVVVITVIVLLLVPLSKRLRSIDAYTIADIALSRFPSSNRIHYILTCVQILWGIFVAALSVFGGSLLITAVTGLPLALSLTIILGVTLAYAVLGGLSAVVFTDAAQWGVIIIGSALFLPLLYVAVDPFSELFSQYLGPDGFNPAPEASGSNLSPGFTDIYTTPLSILGTIAFMMANAGLLAVDPGYAQRALAARSDREGKVGLYMFAAVYLLVLLLILYIGMYGSALRPNLNNPDQVLLIMAQDYLPLVGRALFLTAVAAAAMSTISTYLNVTSGLFVKNILVQLRPDMGQQRQVLWARLGTVAVALVTLLFIPIASGGLVSAAVAGQVILIGAIGPLLYFSLFWRNLTEPAAFWGTVLTSVTAFILILVVGGPGEVINGAGIFGIPVMFWALGVAAIVFVGVSLLRPHDSDRESPNVHEMFKGGLSSILPSRLEVGLLGGLWIVLFIPWVYMKLAGIQSAFPPLSGPLSWLTDASLLIIAGIILLGTVYILSLIVRYARRGGI